LDANRTIYNFQENQVVMRGTLKFIEYEHFAVQHHFIYLLLFLCYPFYYIYWHIIIHNICFIILMLQLFFNKNYKHILQNKLKKKNGYLE
jgi:hypothetical protein